MNKNREKEILHLLAQGREVKTAELIKYTGSSESTIRRDLIDLQEEGLLIRTFGGAQLPVKKSLLARTFDDKTLLMKKEKSLIGMRAAQLIESGMVLTLDGGTTLWSTFEIIKDKAPLTIFTNAFSVVENLGSTEGISIFCAGGKFRPNDLDFVGTTTVEVFSKVRSDVALLGADSFNVGIGVFADNEEIASTTRAMEKLIQPVAMWTAMVGMS